MDNSSEVAERVVRLSMDGAVVALKISGNASKHLIILLHAILNDQNKTSGKMKLISMLKQQKELKVFTLSEDNLKKFANEVKTYGVTYCVLRDKDTSKGHPVEIMVKAEDASKIERIFERLEFGKVDTTSIEAEIEKSLQDVSQNPPEQTEISEKQAAEIENEAPIRKDGEQIENPFPAQTEKSLPSENISTKREIEGKGLNNEKKSVRKEIENIKEERIKDNNGGAKTMADREKELQDKIASPPNAPNVKFPKDRDGR